MWCGVRCTPGTHCGSCPSPASPHCGSSSAWLRVQSVYHSVYHTHSSTLNSQSHSQSGGSGVWCTPCSPCSGGCPPSDRSDRGCGSSSPCDPPGAELAASGRWERHAGAPCTPELPTSSCFAPGGCGRPGCAAARRHVAAAGLVVRVSGSQFRVSNLEFKGLGSEFRSETVQSVYLLLPPAIWLVVVWGLRFQVQGFGFRVQSRGFSLAGSELWVSGFGSGFRVSQLV